MTSSRPQARKASASKSSDNKQSLEKRKLRNRISQQAFRTRQNLRVLELEERLQDLSRPDAARIAQLQDQNAALRDQLLECHKKLTSFEISLQDLKGRVAQALGLPARDRDTLNHSRNGRRRSSRESDNQSESQSDAHCNPSPPASEHLPESPKENVATSPQAGTLTASTGQAMSNVQMENVDAADVGFTNSLPLSSTTIVENIDWFEPSTEPHNYTSQSAPANSSQQALSNNGAADPALPTDWEKISQLCLRGQCLTPPGIGIGAYQNMVDTFSLLSKTPSAMSRTNSGFSDHIDALERACLQNWGNQNGFGLMNAQISKVVHFMLSAFVSISWSSMIGWNSHIRALGPLRDVMVWRLNKTLDSYLSIVPSYRPTKLQMSVHYPSIIDWTPWPSLRDKLIIHHSANPRLDDLICEIGNSYVVPADLSKLVVCPQPVHGYVNVWDIVRAIEGNAHAASFSTESVDSLKDAMSGSKQWLDGFSFYQDIVNSGEQECVATATEQLPATDANALFSSRSLAIRAFKLLGMDRGAFRFCLDPKFFENHPELYSFEENIMAYGVALRADTVTSFPAPQDLDSVTVKRYEELSKHALDAANASALTVA